MNFSQLLNESGISHPRLISDPDISGITINSNEVSPGTLFVAIEGFTTDGHKFCDQAIRRGAVAIIGTKDLLIKDIPYLKVSNSRKVLSKLASNFYSFDKNREHLKLFGITGTNGKTTTAYFTRHFLEQAGLSTGLIGTIEYITGNRRIPAQRTTPEAIEIHKMIKDMSDSGDQALVMEVSSHSLELSRVDDLKFDVAAFTNLSPEHLDFHHDMESYFKAKLKLFTSLMSGEGKIIVNIDDNYGQRLKKMSENCITVSAHSGGDWVYSITEIDPYGIQFKLNTPYGNHNLNSKIIGDYNINNIVTSLAMVCGVYPEKYGLFIDAVRTLPQIRGRLERIGKDIFVDYSHTPDALEKVLKTLRFPGNKVTVVFGAGGNRDKQKRPLMGAIAEKYADKIVLTNDNPRDESPSQIIDEIASGINDRSKVNMEEDREKAIKNTIENRERNELVLIAGKGHETYQEIGQKRIPFDDREVVARYLR